MGDCRRASRGAAAVVRSTQPLDVRTEAEDPCGAGGRARELAALDGRCGDGALAFLQPQAICADAATSWAVASSASDWPRLITEYHAPQSRPSSAVVASQTS